MENDQTAKHGGQRHPSSELLAVNGRLVALYLNRVSSSIRLTDG